MWGIVDGLAIAGPKPWLIELAFIIDLRLVSGFVILYLRDVFFQEIHPDGLFVVLGEDPFAISLNHRRLSNSSITHYHNL